MRPLRHGTLRGQPLPSEEQMGAGGCGTNRLAVAFVCEATSVTLVSRCLECSARSSYMSKPLSCFAGVSGGPVPDMPRERPGFLQPGLPGADRPLTRPRQNRMVTCWEAVAVLTAGPAEGFYSSYAAHAWSTPALHTVHCCSAASPLATLQVLHIMRQPHHRRDPGELACVSFGLVRSLGWCAVSRWTSAAGVHWVLSSFQLYTVSALGIFSPYAAEPQGDQRERVLAGHLPAQQRRAHQCGCHRRQAAQAGDVRTGLASVGWQLVGEGGCLLGCAFGRWKRWECRRKLVAGSHAGCCGAHPSVCAHPCTCAFIAKSHKLAHLCTAAMDSG